MTVESINITLGTAGHVDHGKTALIKLLTGCDTDSLKEEKERGLSIDLGYAPCRIGDLQVGVVDVPGHEKFIKTVVAGASGMDGCILVIAADDGVMPQTREHLDILTLLGIRHGVVALSKSDLVGPELLEVVRDEVREFLADTFLANAPVVPVSSRTGEGLGDLWEALEKLVDSIQPRPAEGVFRLPVDRAFSAKGHGTVVAGVPACGSARVGDELVLLPEEVEGRVKAIEVYSQSSETCVVGQCAALNVPDWDHDIIERGDTVTVPGFFSPGRWYAADLQLLRIDGLGIGNGDRIRFHTGTSEIVGKIYLMKGGSLTAGRGELVQVRLSEPVVAGPGDPFILRSMSPVRTIGGGHVIERISRKLKRTMEDVYEDLRERAAAVLDEEDFVEYCVRDAGAAAVTEECVARRIKVPVERAAGLLDALTVDGAVIRTDSGFIHRTAAERAREELNQTVEEYHRERPASPGIKPEDLKEVTELGAIFDWLVEHMKERGELADRNGRLALPGHSAQISENDRALMEKVENLFLDGEYRPPKPSEIASMTSADPDRVRKVVRILKEHGKLVEVDDDMLFHREVLQRAKDLLVSHIEQEGKLESVDYKYLLGTSRKFALSLLDYFDRIGLTRRDPNWTRYLR